MGRNNEGYIDATASQAIASADREKARRDKLLSTIHYICNVAGFKIDGRITLVDKSTGKMYK